MLELAKSLEDYTARHSNFQTKRNYISLSHIALDDHELLKQWFQGFEDSYKIRLRCYKGYQMERDLIQRLISIYGKYEPECKISTGKIKLGVEYSSPNGLFKGHPEGELIIDRVDNAVPFDCKSVPLDEHLPDGKLPRKVYWQMQAYMLYGKKDKACVLYESRETGIIREYWLRPNTSVQADIQAKVNRVSAEIPCAA
jgi:hypothetical protein